jgi:hypothetical protein
MPKRPQPKPIPLSRLCLFCNNAADSGEHLWPNWMRPYFKKGAHDQTLTTWQKKFPDAPDAVVRTPTKGHPTNLQIEAVCHDCNTGWMSRMETPAKAALTPMLKGDPIDLDSVLQRALLRWVTLKLMVFELADEEEGHAGPIFTREQTLAFARDGSIPDNLEIRLLHCEAPAIDAGANRESVAMLSSDPGLSAASIRPNTQSIVFCIGQLVIHATHSTVDMKLKDEAVFFFRRLWPFDRAPLYWPPVKPTGAQAVTALWGALRRYTDRPGMISL